VSVDGRLIRQQAGADYQTQLTNAQAGGGGGDIDAFMNAISGQESGGNYNAVNADSGASGKFQIMPNNWGPWSQRAGLGPNAPRTPQNQELVAKRIMMDYYQQFGNWRDVAVAWYAGPGRVAQVRNSDTRQGGGKYPSIRSYADTVMRRFAANRASSGAGAAVSGLSFSGGAQQSPLERFDPAAIAEAELKRQDPVGFQAHEFGNRAVDFFSLLNGQVA